MNNTKPLLFIKETEPEPYSDESNECPFSGSFDTCKGFEWYEVQTCDYVYYYGTYEDMMKQALLLTLFAPHECFELERKYTIEHNGETVDDGGEYIENPFE